MKGHMSTEPERRVIVGHSHSGHPVSAPVTDQENNPTGMRWRIGEDGTFRLEVWCPEAVTFAFQEEWIEVPLYVPKGEE